MDAGKLHVVAARFNPLRWEVPEQHYRDWVGHVLDSGARLTVAEVQYGERPFVCALPHVNHIGLRATSRAWGKECALNLAIQRIPEADYIAWGDADVWHRDPAWARETVEALQHYVVVQTWTQCLDLGPFGASVMQTHDSFAHCHMRGLPLTPTEWKAAGTAYPHSGFFWAGRRSFLDAAGGLFEVGGMGSGDHHMALGMVGRAESSVIGGASVSYRRHVTRWGERAARAVNGRLGAAPGVIEHRFHGSKAKRGYLSRWDMFVKHGFDPDTDLIRNSYGMLEFAGNKPALEQDWDRYLAARAEDDNCT